MERSDAGTVEGWWTPPKVERTAVPSSGVCAWLACPPLHLASARPLHPTWSGAHAPPPTPLRFQGARAHPLLPRPLVHHPLLPRPLVHHTPPQGIKELITALQRRGVHIYLISGGFRWATGVCVCGVQ